MKKQNLFFLTFAVFSFALLACSSSSSDDSKKTGWDLENLRGKVKFIKIEEYDAVEKDGVLEKTALWQTRYHKFDKDGQTISFVQDSPYGHAEMTCIYSQDKMTRKLDMDGDLITSEVTFTPWGDYQSDVCDEWKSRTEYRYDDRHRLIEILKYDDNKLVSRNTDYKHDENGRETQSVCYDAKGEVSATFYHVYNEQGDVVEYRVMHSFYELKNQYTYIYDDHGNYIRRECLSSNPNFCKIEECTIEYYE